jgi:PTH1 family peptidyl-tRNA hydrolase
MKLIVGLGNPGEKYKNNRHNIGHMFVDYLINKLTDSQINKFKLYKTDCFMNLSGKFVKKIISNFNPPAGGQISNLIVVHDDLDIPLGKFKIQKGTGPLLHNGIESIENALGATDFWRIRIGVDNRPARRSLGEGWVDGENYVLQNFQPVEKETVQLLFPKILTRLKEML